MGARPKFIAWSGGAIPPWARPLWLRPRAIVAYKVLAALAMSGAILYVGRLLTGT